MTCPTRPGSRTGKVWNTMTDIRLHLDTDEAESVLDASLAGDDAEYPGYVEAFASVQHKANDALNGEAEDADCLRCLGYAVDVADRALHAALLRAAPGRRLHHPWRHASCP